MRSLEISAPAKVNLFLRVLGRRRDGYHNILTLFERIALEDTVVLKKTPSGVSLSCDRPVTARPEDNLAYKAAILIKERARIKSGIGIHIRKRIPVAAGLGGGSSDAASALLGINRLFGLGMGLRELSLLGSRLGADVPFFLNERPFAAGKGIGDKVYPIASKARFWHLLVYPGFGLSTKEVYGSFKSSKALTSPLSGDKIRPSDSLLFNDLQKSAVRKRPVIGALIERLANLSVAGAIVSGSGPSVFCLYKTRREAVGARRRLFRDVPPARRRRWQVFVVETKHR